MTIFPAKLKKGSGVRVIAPSRSLALSWISEELKTQAKKRMSSLGLELSFGKHVNEIDDYNSTSIESRVEDLHDAFRDPSIDLVITVIGGFNVNQLLRYLDYDLIKTHPKILCGYSDITALTNAIFAKTGLVTYSGPQFFSFGDIKGFDYTEEYFKKCLFNDAPFKVQPCEKWSDDRWANDQVNRTFIDNEGFWVINEGSAEGTIIGGNQCTFNLLQGTEYMPNLEGSVLFLEDDDEAHAATVDRDLQSLIHQPGFEKVKAIVFGRFQPEMKITKEILMQIVKSKKELDHLPIIGNVDFGHTTPHITFPIGGTARIEVGKDSIVEIFSH